MTSTECYDLIKRGVDIEVPGLELYYDKVVCELRGWSNVFLVELLLCLYKKISGTYVLWWRKNENNEILKQNIKQRKK